MTHRDLSQHRDRAHYYAMVFGQCLEDFEARREGRDVNYLLDYSLLHPQFFDGTTPGTKPPLLSTRDVMRRVLAGAAEYDGFQLIVSGATVLEFEDTLCHLLNDLQLHLRRMPSLKELREEAAPASSLTVGARVEKLHRYLNLLTEDGRAERVTRPIAQLLAWLDDGTIEPASDVLDMATLTPALDGQLFDKFVDEHRQARLASDKRDYENALFHYKLDAANVVFTRAALDATSDSVLFVTPTPLNTEQCADGAVALGRSQATPLWRLNADEQHDQGMIGDVRRYFRRGAIEGEMLADDIPASAADPRLPAETMDRIMQYYGSTVGLLAYGSAEERATRTLSRDDVVRMEEVLASPRRIREVQEDMVEEIRDGAREINRRLSDDDIAYLTEFRFEDDPILAKVRSDLGLDPLTG